MLNVSVDGTDVVIRNLSMIKSPTLRRRVFMVASRQLIKAAKARISNQKDLDGQAFAPHAKGRKRKMLARLIRRIADSYNGESAEVGWRNSFEGGIAYKQQMGFTQRFNKSQFKDRTPASQKDPATRQQAKALLEAGYKTRAKGKALKTPTLKWITQNLTIGQAGLILRVLRGSKTEWTTKLPPRSFLGVTKDDLDAINALVKTELQKAFDGVAA